VHGKKRIVWRCISRLDHGSRYCQSSPTLHEEPLHSAIVKAVNEYYDCGGEVAELLKDNVMSVLAGVENSEIQEIERRLEEIDRAREELVNLIVSGDCGEDTLDAEFKRLYAEEGELNSKLQELKSQNQGKAEEKISNTIAEIERSRFELKHFDDVLIRKLIECIKVVSKTELLLIFKGGYEVRTKIEK
jgi:hypothetical protein